MTWITVEDEPYVDGYEAIYRKERIEGLNKALNTLTDRERTVLIDRIDEKSFAEIGKRLHISVERTRQICSKANRKMRDHSRTDILKEYGWKIK